MRFLLIFLSLVLFSINALSAGEIVAALTEPDGNKRKIEYEHDSPLYEYYAKQGIRSSFIDYHIFSSDFPRAKLLQELKKFHVVLLRMTDETVAVLNDKLQRKALEVGEVLQQYVESGGGLVLVPVNTRYSGHDDEKFWNLVFKPLGLVITREGVADLQLKTNHEWKTGFFNDFFPTGNIVRHPVTENISNLWFPVFSYTKSPGTTYIDYSADWQILVRGEKTAATYQKNSRNILQLELAGTVKSEPAIVAARTLGKGRVVCIPIQNVHTGQNYGKPTWSHIVEDRGADGKSGGGMKLLSNALKWCAEPVADHPEFGSYVAIPYEKIQFPESVSWDDSKFGAVQQKFYKYIFGLHSNYSDGQSSVEDYVLAAKAAGLSGIVFADSLEKLTAEKFESLQRDCVRYSAPDFYACPGVEFTDASGIRWFFAGEKVTWPEEKPFQKGNYTYRLWDGERILNFGRYSIQCAFPTVAVIDYAKLEKNQVHRENLWWFWQLIPYAFENDRLIADNRAELDFALRDIRWQNYLPFTRIFSADAVGLASRKAVLKLSNPALMKDILTKGSSSSRFVRRNADASVTYGGPDTLTIRAWRGINHQQDPRMLKTRGTQRVRMLFDVFSPDGIDAVKVMDAQAGEPLRVFNAQAAKEFSREFELVHDRQHFVYLEVTDRKGARAISDPYYIYDYKQGLFRCGDNLNVLGPLGYWWHPDRPELLPLSKIFRNAEKLSVMGWDRAAADCPFPSGRNHTDMYIDGKGNVADFLAENVTYYMRMNVRLSSGDLQIVDSIMDELGEKCDTAKRPGPSNSSPPKMVASNPYIIHQQRLYSPRDRMDHHIAWDNRRYLESIEEYDGSMHLFTGEIRFRQDTRLSNDSFVPIELASTYMEPRQSAQYTEKILMSKDAQKGFFIEEFTPEKRKVIRGSLESDAYVAVLQSPVGYIALVPLSGGEWKYSFGNSGTLNFGIGEPGKLYKEGENIRYAFASFSIVGNEADPARVETLIDIVRGKFPMEILHGTRMEDEVLIRFQAKGHSARFSVGPKSGAGIDLPFAVSGLQDNGCAAIFTTVRPSFRFVPFETGKDTVYFQEPIEKQNQIWCGNVFTAEDPSLQMTLVVDGQSPGKRPFIEIHNPGGKSIRTVVKSPLETPLFNAISFTAEIPPYASIRHEFDFEELSRASQSIHDEFLKSYSLKYLQSLMTNP